MPTKYYKSGTVSGTANTETLTKILTSTEEAPKTVNKLYVTEITATENLDSMIRGYIERERIMEFDQRHLHDAFDSDTRFGEVPDIELNHDIPVGQSLSVGHVSGGTASNFAYTVEYEITGRGGR